MPISRFHIRCGHSLADPELHRVADKDDPEALLEAIAMAGIVGVLRQLGDLAQFAAEIFHDLHEEVLATAARGHSLISRVQQLEAEVPALEKACIDWHPILQSEQNLITCGDFPRFIMDSYEECRGPPRLFLLDKFDVAGAGACLKRYTDPSFFKVESASSVTATVEIHSEKRIRKVKKKGAKPWNGETPEVVSSHAKLHELFLEERIENACRDPARLVKLRKKQLNGYAGELKTGKSYMEKILDISSPDHKMVSATSVPVKLISDNASENGIKILEISGVSPVERSLGNERSQLSPNQQELELKPCSEMNGDTNGDIMQVNGEVSASVTTSNLPKVPDETEFGVDEQKRREYSLHGYHSDDVTSDVDDYLDAFATMEEMETDIEPKQSLLHIQKATESNGKEQQLQAQLSDSQSFGGSLTSEEISAFNQYRNGEHTKEQALLSDSESPQSSSVPEDNRLSTSDRIEHSQLQAQFSDSQSIGNSSTSEIENVPYNQLFQPVEMRNTQFREFVMQGDECVHKQEIFNCISVSSGSGVMDLRLLSSDHGPTLSLARGTQSGETPSVPVEMHLRSEDEDIKSQVESIFVIPDAFSLIEDDACHMISFDNNCLNNLGVCDPSVNSNALSQVSNDLNLAHGDEYGDHSMTTEVLREVFHNQHSSESLVSGDIGSHGEDPIWPSMEADLNIGTKFLLDGQYLKPENGVKATQHNSEGLYPVVVTSPVSSFTEELSSDFTHGKPQDEPDSAEAIVLYSDQQSNFDEAPRMMLGDEIHGSIVENDGHIKHMSSPDYSRQDNHVIVHNASTKRTHSEDQASPAIPLVDSGENDSSIFSSQASGFVSSPSRNLLHLPEPFSNLSNSHQVEIESNEAELSKIPINLNSEDGENKLQPYSNIISSPMKRHKKSESPSTFAGSYEKEIEVHEAVAHKSLTELMALKVGQPEIAIPDVRSNLSRSVPCYTSDSEICSNMQGACPKEKIQQKESDQPKTAADVQPKLNRSVPCDPEIYKDILEEKIQYSSAVNDEKMVPLTPELESQRLESILFCQNDVQSKASLLSPSCNQLKPETHLELFLKSPVGYQGTEVPLRNGDHISDKFQLRQIQISNQLEQQRISHVVSEFAPEMHQVEPSSFDSSPKSSFQETKLQLLLPDPFLEAANDHEEMPPLPPLPPMQWRMGRVQHTSLVSLREIEASQASIQPIQAVKLDDKSKFGLSTSDRDENPFLPVMSVENNMLQHSGFLAGVSEDPCAIPLQYPIMVNESNGQYNYLIMENNQNQNPFLTLPMVSTGRPPYGYIIGSEGEMVQNSSPCPSIPPPECSDSGVDPISPQEKPIESPTQLMVKTSLEGEDGHREFHSVLPIECAASGDDSISPKENSTPKLIEETCLEFEMLEQSSIDLESKQGDPSISPVSAPSIEIVQPRECSPPSKGEVALSLDASAQAPEFGSEMPNGKPKTKLLLPWNPLIDAVAAIDKSRLRKVSERVRPHVAPKVDERDSLLEQIRSKSFNLRPAVATRPNIEGPKTNLRVAAILEKANSIRQALAGSDEDDDADSWSDS